jgi:hypothetical protein
VGLAGAFVFVLRLFAWPRWLGAVHLPRTSSLVAYLLCVMGEVALIRLGDAGHPDARPTLVAGVVGLHFIPFAWAFGERMFYWLGASLALLGELGLVGELGGIGRAAPWSAVTSGWVIAGLLLCYASGAFARPAVRPGAPGEVRAGSS